MSAAAVNGRPLAVPRGEAGEVSVTLGGHAMVLRPTFAAISETETLTGMGLVELARHVSAKRIGVQLLAAILTPGLKAGSEPQANVEAVAKLVYETGVASEGLLESAILYLEAALNGGQVPDQAEAEEGKEKPAGAQTTTRPAG